MTWDHRMYPFFWFRQSPDCGLHRACFLPAIHFSPQLREGQERSHLRGSGILVERKKKSTHWDILQERNYPPLEKSGVSSINYIRKSNGWTASSVEESICWVTKSFYCLPLCGPRGSLGGSTQQCKHSISLWLEQIWWSRRGTADECGWSGLRYHLLLGFQSGTHQHPLSIVRSDWSQHVYKASHWTEQT